MKSILEQAQECVAKSSKGQWRKKRGGKIMLGNRMFPDGRDRYERILLYHRHGPCVAGCAE